MRPHKHYVLYLCGGEIWVNFRFILLVSKILLIWKRSALNKWQSPCKHSLQPYGLSLLQDVQFHKPNWHTANGHYFLREQCAALLWRINIESRDSYTRCERVRGEMHGGISCRDEPRSSLGRNSHDRRSPSRERCVRHPPPPSPLRRRPPPSYPASLAPLSEQQECEIVPALTPCCCASAARCRRHCCFFLRELRDRIRAASPSMPHRWRGVDLLSQIGRVRNSPSTPLSRLFLFLPTIFQCRKVCWETQHTQLEAAAADGPELSLRTRNDRTYPARSGNM